MSSRQERQAMRWAARMTATDGNESARFSLAWQIMEIEEKLDKYEAAVSALDIALDRDRAERKEKMSLPEIEDVRVFTDTCDEWYGVGATFKWVTPLEGLPTDTFDWEARHRFGQHAVERVLAHLAFAEYYTEDHFAVVCTTGSDYTQRTVRIPRFNRTSNWEASVTRHDGNVWFRTSD